MTQQPAGVPPVADDETVYRRVPAKWYDPVRGFMQDPFLPTERDDDGLSLGRGCLTPEMVAGKGPQGKEFWVVAFLAREVRSLGVSVIADAIDHAFIPEMSRANYVANKMTVKNLAAALKSKSRGVSGPFSGQASGPAGALPEVPTKA